MPLEVTLVMKPVLKELRPLAVLAGLAPFAGAQTPVVLVKDADVVTGVGNVTSIENLAVNASGTWLVEVDTDNPNSDLDGAVLRDAAIQLKQGDALAPAGATLLAFDALTLNQNGDSGWNFFLNGLPSNADSGIYFNATLVVPEGAISTAPQFSPSTPYTGFFETKFNSGNQILVVASVDDSAVPSTTDRALVVMQTDSLGTLLSETVLAKEGDLVAGIPIETIVEFGTGPHEFALNAAGVALYSVDLTGTTTVDGAIVRGGVVVAREGDPSPLAGRNWNALFARNLDLNDAGDWVVSATVTGATASDLVIVKNGTTVIAQEGGTLPAISPFTFTSFGTGPVRIDNGGNVYWFGDWNDPDTTRDAGLFRNGDLIVREGVTLTSGGEVIESVSAVQDAFTISPDGRWIVFEGKLAGGIDAAFRLELVPTTAGFCFGDGTGTACPCGNAGLAGNGCANSLSPAGANLAVSGTASLSSDSLVLSGTTMPNSSALYFQGTTKSAGGAGTVFGDGLRCAGGTVIRLKTVTNVAGASQYPQGGDPSVSVRGLVLAPGSRTYQVWYRNAAAFCTASTFNLSNGVEVQWSL